MTRRTMLRTTFSNIESCGVADAGHRASVEVLRYTAFAQTTEGSLFFCVILSAAKISRASAPVAWLRRSQSSPRVSRQLVVDAGAVSSLFQMHRRSAGYPD